MLTGSYRRRSLLRMMPQDSAVRAAEAVGHGVGVMEVNTMNTPVVPETSTEEFLEAQRGTAE